jgi:hypothetical protein
MYRHVAIASQNTKCVVLNLETRSYHQINFFPIFFIENEYFNSSLCHTKLNWLKKAQSLLVGSHFADRHLASSSMTLSFGQHLVVQDSFVKAKCHYTKCPSIVILYRQKCLSAYGLTKTEDTEARVLH